MCVSLLLTSPSLSVRTMTMTSAQTMQVAERDERMSLDPQVSIILCRPVLDTPQSEILSSSPSSLFIPSSESSSMPPGSLNALANNIPIAEPSGSNHIERHRLPSQTYTPVTRTRIAEMHQSPSELVSGRRAENNSSFPLRKEFVNSITKPSSRRGFLICRLCTKEIWGPNGRYHIEKCQIISNARIAARRTRTLLTSISGFRVDSAVFKKPKPPKPKPAKIVGFVMSNSVSLADPGYSPTVEEIENGIPVGKKGWVRCLVCNIEIFAPNAKYHASICHWLWQIVSYRDDGYQQAPGQSSASRQNRE